MHKGRLDNLLPWHHMVTSEVICFSFKTYFTGQADCWKTLECTINTFTTGKSIYHFRNGKKTGAEIRPAIRAAQLLADIFPVPSNSPKSLCESKLGPVSLSWWILQLLYSWLGSLSNDDGDVNENGKKGSWFRLAKQAELCTCITPFCTFLCPSLHDYNVKVPNFTFCRGREHKTTFFFFSWTLIQAVRIQLWKNLSTFDELNELD